MSEGKCQYGFCYPALVAGSGIGHFHKIVIEGDMVHNAFLDGNFTRKRQ